MTSPADMEHIKLETDHVAGLLGLSGDPSPVTAYGVYVGMKAAAKARGGKAAKPKRPRGAPTHVAILEGANAGETIEVGFSSYSALLFTGDECSDDVVQADHPQRARGSGMGRFLNADRIMAQNPISTSDLFRMLPGFIGDGSIQMKSNFSDGAGNFGVNCTPEVYVDGHLMRGIGASELDGLLKPEDIAGMEVYSAGSPKPAQFDSGMSGCGALVIWQKPPLERIRRRRE